MTTNDKFNWAKRVSRRDIQRLYDSDAKGMLDEDLLDQVHYAIHARVCDMFEVREAQQLGRVKCRNCGAPVPQPYGFGSWNKKNILKCEQCGWQVTCGEFYDSYTGKSMLPGSAVDLFETYLERFPKAKTASEKMLLIDWLIHEFHVMQGVARMPVGENVIQGTTEQVRELIETLAGGPGSTQGLSSLEEWRRVYYDPVRLFKQSHSHSEVQKIAARLGIRGRSQMSEDDLIPEILRREMTQANRKGWDGLAETHFKNYHVDKLIAGTPLLNDLIQKEVGDVKGKSLAHLLCHIGTDTLSWALLGAQVTGIDISPESLKYARNLAETMAIAADFIEADIMDVMEKVNKKFDIVFSSTGVLCWLPDIQRYAQTVRQLLKDDGFFYIFDGHPFRSVLIDEAGSSSTNTIQGNYFRKEVWQYGDMGDYTDPDLKIPVNSYEWNWTMGELITAFCQAGMRIVFLHEFPQYFYNGYTPYDIQEDRVELYPCTFSLKAMAK